MMFSWFNRKTQQYVAIDEDTRMIHGHDLAVWKLLGSTLVPCPIGSTVVFFFYNPVNKARSVAYVGLTVKDHLKYGSFWISRYVEPWVAGEWDIYSILTGKNSLVSIWLQQYMLEEFNVEWDTKKFWWSRFEQSKYNGAAASQATSKSTPTANSTVTTTSTPTTADGNIITVDFGK